MISFKMGILFYQYRVDESTGNKGKYIICFKHAVKRAMKNEHVEHELIETDDFIQCHDCLYE